jgi:uncharacterized protein with von Willebrand factor type A (vWA) domain
MSDDTWGEKWDVLSALSRRPDEVNAIEHDRFNARAWAGARKEIKALRDQVNKFTMDYDYALEFLQDIFYLLLKGDPQLRPLADMKASHIPNHVMAEAFSKYPEVEQLREHTRSLVMSTVMAELSMDTEIHEALEAMKRARQIAERLQELMEQLRSLAEQSRLASEQGEDTTGIDAAFESAMADAEDALNQLTGAAEQAAADAAMGLRSAARGAADEAAEQDSMLSAYGVEPGTFQRMSFKDRAALLQRLRRNRVVDFARLIGAFRNVADAAWRKRVSGVPDEVSNVTFGDDLARILPTELMSLALPGLDIDFLRRFASRELMQFEVRGKERQGMGAMVLVCDESGSMGAPLGGATREAWAKAFCLGLAWLAKKQHRPVIYIGFSSRHQQRMVDLTTHDTDAVLEMTEGFLNGGTHFEKPLDMALALIAQARTDDVMRRADVVFLSDDEYCSVSEEFLLWWKEQRIALSVACHGVLIGAHESGAMSSLCDSMRSVDDVIAGTEVQQAGDVFGKVS